MLRDLRIEEIPLGDARLKDFVRFSWQHYRGDPCWTPPLNGDLLGNKLLGLKGLLTPNHPYHKHAEVTHFLARRGNESVGRISAAINRQFNDFYHTQIGFFGFFEVVNDYEVARQLLDRARDWIAKRGMTAMRGPGEYSNATHERQALLIEGFQYPPTTDLTHNPPYYADFLERYGLRKVKDYDAYLFDPPGTNFPLIKRMAQRVSCNPRITTRALVMKDLRDEVRLILEIYNSAWAENWGFLPVDPEEGDAVADSLRLIIDPGLVRFGYVDGKAAAVMGVLPDPNYALRPRWRWYGDSDLVRMVRLLRMRRHIPFTRGMFFGIKPEYRKMGIPALLTDEIIEYFLPQHYQELEGSLILENNGSMIKIIKRFGGRHYKKWRIYEMPLK
jgi:GNAT superfamily N-acetyltransferase